MLKWFDRLICGLFGHSYSIIAPCRGPSGENIFSCIYCGNKVNVVCQDYHCSCCGKHTCKLSRCYCNKCCVEYLFDVVSINDLSMVVKTYIYCCNVYGHEVTANVINKTKFDPIRDDLANALLLI